jgi:CHAT domain-containing protein/Tfp pilus assembly protein PilF
MKYRMALIVLTLLVALTNAQNKQDEVRALKPGETVERELSGGATDHYSINLKSGDFLRAIIEQQGIDVVVALIGPDGKKLIEVDSPNGAQGSEPLFWIVEATGEYQLEVRSLESGATAGRYAAKGKEVRQSTEVDKKRVAAQLVFAEATSLIGERTVEARRKRLEKYKEALLLWQASDEVERQILTLNSMGAVHSSLGEKRESLQDYQQALAILRAAGDRNGEAATLNTIGDVYNSLGEKQTALEYYTQALPIMRAVDGPRGEATTLQSLASTYASLGDRQKAVTYYTQALSIWRAVADRRREAATLNIIGRLYKDLGEIQKAVDFYNQALPILRAVGDRSAEAAMLNNIGLAYNALGEKQKALNFLNQALPLRRAVGDLKGEATTLNNLGGVYDEIGETRKALDFYTQALSGFIKAGDSASEATTRNNIGGIYSSLGERQKALEYYNQALPILKVVGDRRGEAGTLNNIGLVYYSLGEKQKALEYYSQALPILKEAGDRRGEAATLNNLGLVCNSQGKGREALEYYDQALSINRAIGDRRGEAITLNNIGNVYASLGEKSKALDYYNQALVIRRAVNDRSGEATSLSNIGSVYGDLGENQKALDYYNQALLLSRAVGNRSGEASTLSNIGGIYYSQGEYEKALDYYNQALPIKRVIGDRNDEASALNNIGLTYSELGEKRKSLEYYNQALSIHRAVGDRSGEATTLINIGQNFHSLGEYQRALEYYNQALPIKRDVGDRSGEAATLKSIGSVYRALGEKQKALDFYNQALPIAKTVGDRLGESSILNAIGLIYLLQSDDRKALEYLGKALPIQRAISDRSGEAATLNNLMWFWLRSNSSLAIFYGKESVNIYQQLRGNIKGLDQELQTTFLHSVEHTYRTLADLLIAGGRLPEAQQILGLLKKEEYFEFVRRDGSEASALKGNAELTPEEASVEKRYREIAGRVTALGAEYGQLRDKKTRAPEEEQRLTKLESDLTVANQVFQKFLDEIGQAFAGSAAGSEKAFQLRESQGLMETLRELGFGAVALYTVVGDDKYRVILVTPEVQKAYEYPIKAADLNRKVLEFREAVQNPQVDPRPLAQGLYNILIGPELANDLAQAKAQTLMWSLDGVLRYLPMAALHDGNEYLVERYRNVVFTPASQSRLKDPVGLNWKALGLGVSKAQPGFNPLPGVPEELRGIIRDEGAPTNTTITAGPGEGVLPGRVMLDEAFTSSAMQTALRQHFPLVHIASHFQFKPGNETDSFLLLGDGSHLTLAQIKSLPNVFSGVDLLTLSACDTATGSGANGREVEGFGVLAQRQGAKAVLATLWPVADESTQTLMREFYRFHETNPQGTKAEALRQAQLASLKGSKSSDAGAATTQRSSVRLSTGPSSTGSVPFKADPNAKFSHPYYWAPFILIGNWR